MRKDRLIVVAFVFVLVALVLAIFVGAFVWVYAFSRLCGGKEILSTAQEIKGNESNSEIILNRIADWLQNHMTYDVRSVYYYPIPPFLFWRQVHPDAAWVMTIKRGACEEYAVLCSEMARSVGIESRTVYNPAEDHTWCEVFINGSWIHFDPGLAEGKRFNNAGFYERSKPDGWGKQLSYVFFIGSNGKENDITKTYTDTGRLIVRIEKDNLPVENAKVVVESRFLMETYSNYKEPLFCLEKYTNESGLCDFELGGNNYTVIAEFGFLLKYKSEGIVHLTENSDISATLILSELSIWGVQVDEQTLRLIEIVISPIFILISVYVGWFLAKRTERMRLRVEEIKNELEKAYGPIYSIMSKPEEKLPIDEKTEETRVRITTEEKRRLDEIMMTYPHMFPNKIVAYWRVNIRDMNSIEVVADTLEPVDYALPLEFKRLIYEEYESRLQEYYNLMGRGKEFKKLPKFARV